MSCPVCGLAHELPSAETPLAELSGLGETGANWLRQAGLYTFADLRAMGSVRSWLLVESLGVRPSQNFLYALEGVLHGSHWLEVKRLRKDELLKQLEASRELDSI